MRQKAGQLMAFDPSTPGREAQKALQVRLCSQMAELQKAQPQGMPSGRTSRLEPPASDPLAIHPACSGERHHQPY
jgi:pyruvate-formate lyase